MNIAHIYTVKVLVDEEGIMSSNGTGVAHIQSARVKVDESYLLGSNGDIHASFLNTRVLVDDEGIWNPQFGGGGLAECPDCGFKPKVPSSLSLTLNPNLQETGFLGTIMANVSFQRNDGGARNNLRLSTPGYTTLDNITLNSVAMPNMRFTDSPVTTTATLSQDASADFPAGNITATAQFRGYRKIFWDTLPTPSGTPNVGPPTTGAQVRALRNSTTAPDVNQFLMNFRPGGAREFIFAYPATMGTDIDVRSEDFNAINYAAAFSMSTVSVPGDNEFQPILYNVWYFGAGIVYDDRYTITIK